MSQSEVAAQLGVSQQSVSQLVQEAVHELRRAAQEQRLASKLHLG
jgi:DNA-directed RNA polymerase specialized sigma subunit